MKYLYFCIAAVTIFLQNSVIASLMHNTSSAAVVVQLSDFDDPTIALQKNIKKNIAEQVMMQRDLLPSKQAFKQAQQKYKACQQLDYQQSGFDEQRLSPEQVTKLYILSDDAHDASLQLQAVHRWNQQAVCYHNIRMYSLMSLSASLQQELLSQYSPSVFSDQNFQSFAYNARVTALALQEYQQQLAEQQLPQQKEKALLAVHQALAAVKAVEKQTQAQRNLLQQQFAQEYAAYQNVLHEQQQRNINRWSCLTQGIQRQLFDQNVQQFVHNVTEIKYEQRRKQVEQLEQDVKRAELQRLKEEYDALQKAKEAQELERRQEQSRQDKILEKERGNEVAERFLMEQQDTWVEPVESVLSAKVKKKKKRSVLPEASDSLSCNIQLDTTSNQKDNNLLNNFKITQLKQLSYEQYKTLLKASFDFREGSRRTSKDIRKLFSGVFVIANGRALDKNFCQVFADLDTFEEYSRQVEELDGIPFSHHLRCASASHSDYLETHAALVDRHKAYSRCLKLQTKINNEFAELRALVGSGDKDAVNKQKDNIRELTDVLKANKDTLFVSDSTTNIDDYHCKLEKVYQRFTTLINDNGGLLALS